MEMEKETRDLLGEMKEGRVLDLKVLKVDGSKYDFEDRNKRKTSLFTSRFDQTLEQNHCYRVQWVNDASITVIKTLGSKPEDEAVEELIEEEEEAEAEAEQDEIPF